MDEDTDVQMNSPLKKRTDAMHMETNTSITNTNNTATQPNTTNLNGHASFDTNQSRTNVNAWDEAQNFPLPGSKGISCLLKVVTFLVGLALVWFAILGVTFG